MLDLEQAVDWVLQHGEDAGIDDPISTVNPHPPDFCSIMGRPMMLVEWVEWSAGWPVCACGSGPEREWRVLGFVRVRVRVRVMVRDRPILDEPLSAGDAHLLECPL